MSSLTVPSAPLGPEPEAPLELELEIALPTVQVARQGRWAIGRTDLDNLANAGG